MKILRHTPEFTPSEVVVAEEVIDGCLKDPVNSGYSALVAEDGSEILGYISYGSTPLTEGTWDLYWEAVAQGKRGQGIGGALTKAAEREIRKAQGRLILIETSSILTYEKARRFHFTQGYEMIARIPDFYTVGDDKIILQKRMR